MCNSHCIHTLSKEVVTKYHVWLRRSKKQHGPTKSSKMFFRKYGIKENKHNLQLFRNRYYSITVYLVNKILDICYESNTIDFFFSIWIQWYSFCGIYLILLTKLIVKVFSRREYYSNKPVWKEYESMVVHQSPNTDTKLMFFNKVCIKAIQATKIHNRSA
jgi:hypothetical protein